MGGNLCRHSVNRGTPTRKAPVHQQVSRTFLLWGSSANHCTYWIFYFIFLKSMTLCHFFPPFFVSVWLPVPVPQAAADLEPADLDRVQRGFVPVILSVALWALEPHIVSGPYSLLQLLCPLQTTPRPHRAGQSLFLPSVLQQFGAQVAVKTTRRDLSYKLWTRRRDRWRPDGSGRRLEIKGQTLNS